MRERLYVSRAVADHVERIVAANVELALKGVAPRAATGTYPGAALATPRIGAATAGRLATARALHLASARKSFNVETPPTHSFGETRGLQDALQRRWGLASLEGMTTQQYREMKCPACGWVHLSIPAHVARGSDAPRGRTLQPCVLDA